MTSNNEYYQQILNVVSGETISTYETTLNLMKKICLAYGCTYTDAQCSNKYLKDFAEASIGTTYSENKLNIEYLHDIALNFYPLTDEGTENYYLGIIADYITVTPKLHTDLTIDVPLVLVYSDEFDITGVLTDENDDPVANANINLLVGNTIVDTASTDSTGTVEFTQSPVSMGNHTFQLVFNGNSECYSTSSSTVSRTINKETSVLNVSLPLDGANYYDYEHIAVTGTLYDNDGELINNATVKVYNGSTLLESVNVSNGSFSISNLTDIAGTLGDYTLTIIYEGNDYYTASSVNRTIHIVEEILYDGITLTSDKSILSAYDSESATLTAQLLNGSSPALVAGETVTFEVRKTSDDSLVETLTGTTNGSGVATVSYLGEGVGDLSIKAIVDSVIFSEIYAIEDCDYYADTTKISAWSNVSSGGNAFKKSTYNIDLSSYSVEIQFNTINAQIMIGNEQNWVAGVSFASSPYYLYTHSSSGGTVTDVISSPTASDVWRMEIEGTTIRLYRNETLIITKNNCKVDYPTNLRLYPQNKSSSVDYVKVKPL